MLYRNPTQTTKRTDFWLGFAGTLLINSVVIAIATQQQSQTQQALQQILVLVNIVVLIALAFPRNFAALGMVTAFGIAFGAVVLGGVFFTAGDFAAGGTSGFAGAIVVWVIGAIVIVAAAAFILRAIHRAIK